MRQPFEKAFVRRVSRRRLLEWGGTSLGLLVAACKSDSSDQIDSGDLMAMTGMMELPQVEVVEATDYELNLDLNFGLP